MKKLFFTLMLLVGFAVQALAYDFQAGSLLYTIISNNPPCVSLDGHIDGTNAQGELIIPETITNDNVTYTVTKISRAAFSHCNQLRGNLVIPSTITEISIEAFSYCTQLTGNLIIPNTVIKLGIDYPSNGSEFEGTFECCSKFTSLVLSDSLNKIGKACFLGCKGLTGKLVIPESVTEIGESAFWGCRKLTGELVLPHSLQRIGASAFRNCTGITGTLEIPNSVSRIDDYAFTDVGIQNVVLPKKNLSVGSNVFAQCDGLIFVDIPDGWTILPNFMFDHCKNLKEVHLPETMTCIYSWVFTGCHNLEKINFPDNLKCIFNGAFSHCTSLISHDFPSKLQRIYSEAFEYCTSFSGDLIIPNSVKIIDVHAFRSCDNLENVVLGDSIQEIWEISFQDTQLKSLIIKAVTPPILHPFLIDPWHFPETIPIEVPCGSLKAYQNAENWNKFTNISEDVLLLFSAVSENEDIGTVSILKEASCEDRMVQIEALPNEGCKFLYWEANGEQISSENPYSFEQTEDIELVAHFSGMGLDETEQGFSFYPNPTNDRVKIDGIMPAKVQVYNTLGQLVKTERGSNEINIGSLPQGVYTLNVYTEEGERVVRKVVKE